MWVFFNFQYRYATGFDWLLVITGTLSSGVHGAALPVMFLLFGELTTQFTIYGRFLQCNLNYNDCFSMGLANISERSGPCTVLFLRWLLFVWRVYNCSAFIPL